MPNKWGKPTEEEKWLAEMQRRKRHARILLIRRVVISVVALAIIGGVLMWLLGVFNRQFGDCFDRYGELADQQERCFTYGSPTVEVWIWAIGSVIFGLFILLVIASFIASLIAPPVTRARSKCSCEGACEHEQARQSAMAMGIVIGLIFSSNNNN